VSSTANPSVSPLVINDLRKSFDAVTALDGVNLTLEPGNVLALLGPSGCGKTTLLRCIAGLSPSDSGDIHIGGTRVNGRKTWLPPEARALGMVFQDYALWPHMSVAENVAFPLKMRKLPKADQLERVQWALQTVGLGHFGDRTPETLSGGQQQRVALARAIVAQPKLLLMDEPLSNLDKGLRESLALDIRRLINELNLSAVFVTHDQHEAFALADQVAILQGGQLKQVAQPQTLYEAPANPGIAEFLDAGALLSGQFTRNGFLLDDSLTRLPLVADHHFTGKARLLLPRRALTLSHEPGQTRVRIQGVLFQGESYAIRVQIGGHDAVTLHSRSAPLVNSELTMNIDSTAVTAWAPDDTVLAVRPLGASSPVSEPPTTRSNTESRVVQMRSGHHYEQ